MTIRPAQEQDLAALTEIYGEIVLGTEATCWLTPPPREERLGWWKAHHDSRYPIWVAANGEAVIGYASLSQWMDGPIYAHTVEVSVFLAPGARGQGTGTRLLRALLAEAARLEHHVVIARIWAHNEASLALCRKCGFETVGVQREVGRRRGMWEDCVVLQRVLSISAPATASEANTEVSEMFQSL